LKVQDAERSSGRAHSLLKLFYRGSPIRGEGKTEYTPKVALKKFLLLLGDGYVEGQGGRMTFVKGEPSF